MKTAVANRPEETNLFHILQTPPCKSVFEELQSLKLPETKKKTQKPHLLRSENGYRLERRTGLLALV